MQQQGLSLISLLIAIAVMGILSATAVPGYQHFIQRSELQQAKHQLLVWQSEQVRYRLGNQAFAGQKKLSSPTVKGFVFSVVKVSAVGFQLSAKRKTLLSDGCDELSVDQAGRYLPQQCWH